MTLVSTAGCRIVFKRWIRSDVSRYLFSKMAAVVKMAAGSGHSYGSFVHYQHPLNTYRVVQNVCCNGKRHGWTSAGKALCRGYYEPQRLHAVQDKTWKLTTSSSALSAWPRVWNQFMEILTFKSELTCKCWKYANSDQYSVHCNPLVEVTLFVGISGVHSFS